MPRPAVVLLGLLALSGQGLAYAQEKLERATVRLEQNATDADVEVVFEVISGDQGLATLRVSAPDGRTMIDFRSPDAKLGIRSLVLETPEPVNDGRLQKDFPAGAYTFTGSTVSGEKLVGKAVLSHRLPGAASFVRPQPKERNVPVRGLRLRWRAPEGLASCIVIVENEETGVKVFTATLTGASSALSLPDGLLSPGTVYKLEIGTVARDGNRSFVETSFTTAGNR